LFYAIFPVFCRKTQEKTSFALVDKRRFFYVLIRHLYRFISKHGKKLGIAGVFCSNIPIFAV